MVFALFQVSFISIFLYSIILCEVLGTDISIRRLFPQNIVCHSNDTNLNRFNDSFSHFEYNNEVNVIFFLHFQSTCTKHASLYYCTVENNNNTLLVFWSGNNGIRTIPFFPVFSSQ